MPPSKANHTSQIHELQTNMALMKQTVSTLEHTLISQNAATKQELVGIHEVLREIHDKLDKATLSHSIELVKQAEAIKAQQSEIHDNAKEIERVDSKIAKAGGFIGALFLAILSGAMAWLSPGQK